MPARTLGLSHLSLAVRDPQRALDFYAQAFGVREYHRDADGIQAIGPGEHNVLLFSLDPANAGKAGGIAHFGFRLVAPGDIDDAVAAVLAAGGTLRERGEFAPGLPFAYVCDPDGYEIELWFEPAPPTVATVATPAPAAVAEPGRKRIGTASLAYRCLKNVPGYSRIDDALEDVDDWMGVPVGAYRNPGPVGVVVSIQERGLRWQGGAQPMYAAYTDIAGIESPGGATTETLTLVLADGQRFSLPVRGRQGRFCDSMAMLRFLNRARADWGVAIGDEDGEGD